MICTIQRVRKTDCWPSHCRRLAFEDSFEDAYHFRLVYPASRGMFPIKGAVMKAGPNDPYVLFRREDRPGGGEEYVPLATFDRNPKAEQINPFFS